MTEGSFVLVTKDVRLARGGKPFARLPDIALAPAHSLAVVGASGSGKTTALLALAGIRAPATGTVRVEGVDVWGLGTRARDRLRGRRIGLVFQSFHLVDALTVAGNLRLAAACAGVRADPGHTDRLLAELDLQRVRTRRADKISHGQAQRTAVARALFNRPAVVLADEPTSALDDENAHALMALLKRTAAAEGAGLLIATHDRRVLDAVDGVVEMERLV